MKGTPRCIANSNIYIYIFFFQLKIILCSQKIDWLGMNKAMVEDFTSQNSSTAKKEKEEEKKNLLIAILDQICCRLSRKHQLSS